MERTLVVIKPDGVQKNLIGTIVKYYEDGGLSVKSMEMTNLTKDFVAKHYPMTDEYCLSIGNKAKDAGNDVGDVHEYGRHIVKTLQDYLTEGPVVKMILEGESAIKEVRRITGFTDPTQADKGTIRGDYGTDSIAKANTEGRATRNLIHASGNPEEAEAEIALWFPSN
ncbi:nucleoside-diphosphate kinase [bacterium]|nr:nucleoside-diphosphate kinase [bacterium]